MRHDLMREFIKAYELHRKIAEEEKKEIVNCFIMMMLWDASSELEPRYPKDLPGIYRRLRFAERILAEDDLLRKMGLSSRTKE